MKKEIDWSTAPDWADEACASSSGLAWVGNGNFMFFGTNVRKCMPPLYVDLGFWTIEKRPAFWNGEGPPPVGIEIEAMLPGLGSTTYFWQIAKVVHGSLPDSPGEVLVFSLETTRPGWVDEFRPIRTAEQIAAEELQKEKIGIQIEMQNRAWAALSSIDSPAPTMEQVASIAKALIEAGYRKQVTE